MDIKNVKKSAEYLTSAQLANATSQIVLTPIIVQKCINPVFEQDNVILHHAIIELLVAMMNKMRDCLKIIKETKYSKNELSIFETTVSEIIAKVIEYEHYAIVHFIS